MARIRSIKPEFWTSEQVMECSPLARLLFIGLWNFCDDAGNHPASAKTLKAEVFPGDDISSGAVQGMLDELSANGLLAFYEHAGKGFIHVTGWQHQKIEKPTFKHPKYEPAREGEPPTVNGGMPPAPPIADDQQENSRRVVGEESSNARLPLDPGVEGRGEERKEQEQELPHPPAGAGNSAKVDSLEGFAEFWLAYPKKKSKQDAEKAWGKLKPDASLRGTLMAAVTAQAKSTDWTKDNGAYIPHAATWLNGQRWQDEVKPAPLDRHHGLNGQRSYDQGLEANGDGTFRF